ncbi:carbohydrate diacid transcriptional activator CdaR [Dermatophilus congolensis]|uniref:Carbohydrate diacid transcriptional activator CdaR n=1 Tax=Dermatophilus congolensis TaxID=1863 RepID=A0AA46BMT3_9MICO|nr:helix-turn-helix domain-containing protein [Dermatophilus congolensis]STD08128.1 carbohydrate diacid transcriptional activator CdaR [Dermatophilus congolensis]
MSPDQSRPTQIRTNTLDAITASTDHITAAVRSCLEERLAWYSRLPADTRSWVGILAQSAIRAFIAWYRAGQREGESFASVFSLAPRELTRSISLSQTVELTRTVVSVVEEHVMALAAADEIDAVRAAVATFSREVAFSAARAYAVAAESRGAWDARMESLVVDAVMRGEYDDDVVSRAATIGWHDRHSVFVVVGETPHAADEAVDQMRSHLRRQRIDSLFSVQGRRLVLMIGGAENPGKTVSELSHCFGPGPLVYGPSVAHLMTANKSAHAALAGSRACPGWVNAPRPVAAEELLPERILDGDVTARRHLVDHVFTPLDALGNGLLETADSYLRCGRSVEATARSLFVHANTVRYRLSRIEEHIGYDLTNPREAYVVEVALTVGRLEAAAASRADDGATRQ